MHRRLGDDFVELADVRPDEVFLGAISHVRVERAELKQVHHRHDQLGHSELLRLPIEPLTRKRHEVLEVKNHIQIRREAVEISSLVRKNGFKRHLLVRAISALCQPDHEIELLLFDISKIRNLALVVKVERSLRGLGGSEVWVAAYHERRLI